jgi:hypothetical protein
VADAPVSPPAAAGVGDRVRELAQRWKQETRFWSSRDRIVNHPAYREIIQMGQAAVSLIIEELRSEPRYWFQALKAITGEDPVAPEDRGLVGKMATAWLVWARTRGL